jgi:hypothetical protein
MKGHLHVIYLQTTCTLFKWKISLYLNPGDSKIYSGLLFLNLSISKNLISVAIVKYAIERYIIFKINNYKFTLYKRFLLEISNMKSPKYEKS